MSNLTQDCPSGIWDRLGITQYPLVKEDRILKPLAAQYAPVQLSSMI